MGDSVIWFISKYGVTPSYGNATRQFFLCKYLAKKKKEVILITSQSSNIKKYKKSNKYFSIEEVENFKHYLLKGPQIKLGFSLIRFWSWFVFEWNLLKLTLFRSKLQKPDVIIVSSLSIFTIISGIILKFKFKAKFILEIRDIWPLTLIEIGGFHKYNPVMLILNLIEKAGYLNANAIVGTMPNLIEHVRSTVNKEIPVYCVPQGFDSDNDIEILSSSSKEKLGSLVPNKFSVIYSGTIGSANKIDVILEVASILQSSNIHFYFLGDGPLKDKYEMEYNYLTNITYINPISYYELPLFLNNFDLLICPIGDLSIYKYGISPNKLVDYMRSKRPFIITYNGFPSFVDSEKYCFTVKTNSPNIIAEKILEIMQMAPESLSEMGELAHSIAIKNHDFDVLAEKYIAIINSN
jgi:glycosyltransferase involved in cell wall biosynthesis